MKNLLVFLVMTLGFFVAGCAAHHHGGKHAAHQSMMKNQGHYQRTLETYAVPDVDLIDQNGNKVNLPAYLQSSQPYALNFIFTTCTTICPIMTATFSQFNRELGDDSNELHLISISIDPEYDKPEKLRTYIDKFKMGSNFKFLTGDLDTIIRVEKAFNSYTPDKMLHRPSTIFKEAGSEQWVRIEGLASGSDLVTEYQRLVDK